MSSRHDTDDLVTIRASGVSAPPGWALMQRQLMDLNDEGAELFCQTYNERAGGIYWADCIDDFYERYYNWGLHFSLGGDENVLFRALEGWNAVTRTGDDSIVHRPNHQWFYHGDKARRRFTQQIHREYFNKQSKSGAGSTEWHHMGEANMAFYHFGLADPTISENLRRAKSFAAMYMGLDPLAPNFDPQLGQFRSNIQSSEGPVLDNDVARTVWWLQGIAYGKPMRAYVNGQGGRSSLWPAIKDLPIDWFEDEQLRDHVVNTFEKAVLQGDSPQSLAATALITNAYLYTGEDKYRQWVLDYVEMWMGKIEQNSGIVPDNIGPSGKIGEYKDGTWWGGIYGWNGRGYTNIFHSLTIGAECALLLTGDYGYLDLLRSQVEMLLDNAIVTENGTLLAANKHGPGGWYDHAPLRVKEAAHLYHASQSEQDRALLLRLREGDPGTDWTILEDEGETGQDRNEKARFMYHEGENPSWPEDLMRAEVKRTLENHQFMRSDERTPEQIIAQNQEAANPVATKGLTNVALGAPQAVYNGGLVRATVRYFDAERRRPGLPLDVAAFVDRIADRDVGVHLVNTSVKEEHTVILQAGAFGEHSFKTACARADESRHQADVNGKYLAVSLPPSTSIQIDVAIDRFVNQPSYAFLWHAEGIPIPFQKD